MTSHNCKHRGRPKAITESTSRQLIVQAAARLFTQKGYVKTTTAEIAVCCKISKQTLYRLFPTKAGLFGAVVEYNRPQWLTLPVPDDLPLQEALEAIFRIGISPDEEHDRMQFTNMALSEGRIYPELFEIMKHCGSDQGHLALTEWLRQQADKGRLKLAGDAGDTAYLLMDMVFGSLLRKMVGDMTWRSGEAWRAHIRLAINVFLHGVSPK